MPLATSLARVASASLAAALFLSAGALAQAPKDAAKPAAPAKAAAPASDLPSIQFEKYALPNGLEVILSRDARLPMVAVNLWYHVGPANEEPGRTGFAHLFEHMMFQRSKNVPEDSHFKLLEGAGASDINGTTDFDRTNYFQTLPSNQLELALWLESDRMGWLLDTVTLGSFMNQQDVVRNERRQSVENRPYGMAEEELFHQLFPKEHPYYASVIGSHADIQAATLDNVKSFFKQYYTPNNASLAIVGDFDPAETKKLVEKYFGSLKRGADAPKVNVKTPAITAERRATVKDRIELPQVTMAWITSPIFTSGDADLMVAAQALGGGKSSRLYKSLVYDKQIAQEVSASQYSLTLGSVFTIQAKARPGHTAEELEKAIEAELEALRTTGPDAAEIERAVNTLETGIVSGLERLGGFGGVADRLNMYNHHLKDPAYLPKDIARIRAVNQASVKKVASEQLKNSARVVVQCVPGEPDFGAPVATPAAPSEEMAKSGSESVNPSEAWRATQPGAGTARALNLPTPQTATLANGLTLMLTNRPGLPLAAAALVVRAGSDATPVASPGIASFTAEMLEEGTATRSSAQIADEAARLGATVNTFSGTDATTVSTASLKKNFGQALALMADVAVNPAFPAAEVERRKAARIADLAEERDNPGRVARACARVALYGGTHPYGLNPLGTEESIKATTRESLQGFWKANYAPNNSALVVAGDITMDELKPMAEKAFGAWAKGETKAAPLPEPKPTAARLILVDKPGAAQTSVSVVTLAVSRNTPDYPTLEVLNNAFGGLFSSRINMNLREEHGYTYGAGSGFRLTRRGPGYFSIGSGIRTDVTAEAIGEIVKEIDRIVKEPLSAEEMALAKDSYVRSLPGTFETNAGAAGGFSEIFTYDLGAGYFTKLPGRIDAVTAEAALAAAKARFTPGSFKFVCVGDLSKTREKLEALKLGGVEVRNTDASIKESAGNGK